MDTDDTGGEREVVLQLHRTPVEEESNATHDDPLVDPDVIIREEDRVNHKMDEEHVDPKLVAVAKQEEL